MITLKYKDNRNYQWLLKKWFFSIKQSLSSLLQWLKDEPMFDKTLKFGVILLSLTVMIIGRRSYNPSKTNDTGSMLKGSYKCDTCCTSKKGGT